jgi:hypothetical protein
MRAATLATNGLVSEARSKLVDSRTAASPRQSTPPAALTLTSWPSASRYITHALAPGYTPPAAPDSKSRPI